MKVIIWWIVAAYYLLFHTVWVFNGSGLWRAYQVKVAEADKNKVKQELDETNKQLNDKTSAETKAQQELTKLTAEKVVIVVVVVVVVVFVTAVPATTSTMQQEQQQVLVRLSLFGQVILGYSVVYMEFNWQWQWQQQQKFHGWLCYDLCFIIHLLCLCIYFIIQCLQLMFALVAMYYR